MPTHPVLTSGTRGLLSSTFGAGLRKLIDLCIIANVLLWPGGVHTYNPHTPHPPYRTVHLASTTSCGSSAVCVACVLPRLLVLAGGAACIRPVSILAPCIRGLRCFYPPTQQIVLCRFPYKSCFGFVCLDFPCDNIRDTKRIMFDDWFRHLEVD